MRFTAIHDDQGNIAALVVSARLAAGTITDATRRTYDGG